MVYLFLLFFSYRSIVAVLPQMVFLSLAVTVAVVVVVIVIFVALAFASHSTTQPASRATMAIVSHLVDQSACRQPLS